MIKQLISFFLSIFSPPPKDVKLEMTLLDGLQGIDFSPGTTQFNTETMPILNKALLVLKRDNSYKVRIDGRTYYKDGYQKLQRDRIAAVKDWFVKRGVYNEQMEVVWPRIIPSDKCADYKIVNSDYARGFKKETEYRARYEECLRQVFGNQCVKCGKMSGLAIDHFFLPKNYGGCFVMETVEGQKLNNAIILCASCNSSKSDHSFRDFFDDEELERILELNEVMNRKINE